MTSEDIFEKAKNHGITKFEIGCAMYGASGYRRIYEFNIPTVKQRQKLEIMQDVLNKLIIKKEKNNGNKK